MPISPAYDSTTQPRNDKPNRDLAVVLVFAAALSVHALFVLKFRADIPKYGYAWYDLKLTESLSAGRGYIEDNRLAYRPRCSPFSW
jgi:hypothetical protein